MKEINLIKNFKSTFYLKKIVEGTYQFKIDTTILLSNIYLENEIVHFRLSPKNNLDDYINEILQKNYEEECNILQMKYDGCLLTINEWMKNPQNFISNVNDYYIGVLFTNEKLKLNYQQYISTGYGYNTYFSLDYYTKLLSALKRDIKNFSKSKFFKKEFKNIKSELLETVISFYFTEIDDYLSLISRKQHRENIKNIIVNEK